MKVVRTGHGTPPVERIEKTARTNRDPNPEFARLQREEAARRATAEALAKVPLKHGTGSDLAALPKRPTLPSGGVTQDDGDLKARIALARINGPIPRSHKR